MQNKRMVIITAVVLAVILALLWVLKSGVLSRGGRNIKVVYASSDIERYSIIDDAMVGYTEVPEKYLQPGCYFNVEDVVGQITIAPILRGEQVVGSKLVAQGTNTGLAIKIPEGKRAISINASGSAGVDGLIRPGDHVDILATFQNVPYGGGAANVVTRILPNVLVLAVGGSMDENAQSTTGSITLAVSSEEAEVLAFTEDSAKIRLVLRPIGDENVEKLENVSFESVLRLKDKFDAQRAPKPKPAPAPAPVPKPVEIIKGAD